MSANQHPSRWPSTRPSLSAVGTGSRRITSHTRLGLPPFDKTSTYRQSRVDFRRPPHPEALISRAGTTHYITTFNAQQSLITYARNSTSNGPSTNTTSQQPLAPLLQHTRDRSSCPLSMWDRPSYNLPLAPSDVPESTPKHAHGPTPSKNIVSAKLAPFLNLFPPTYGALKDHSDPTITIDFTPLIRNRDRSGTVTNLEETATPTLNRGPRVDNFDSVTYYQDFFESQDGIKQWQVKMERLEKQLGLSNSEIREAKKANKMMNFKERKDLKRIPGTFLGDTYPYYQDYLDSEAVRVELVGRCRELEKAMNEEK